MKYEELFVESKLPKPLSKEELNSCFIKYKQGDLESREKIIIHSIKLVLNQVMKKFSNTSYDKRELVTIGISGLIKSVDTFDTQKNVAFSTYAIKCIDNEILMFLRKEKKLTNIQSINDSIGINKDGKELIVEDVLEDEKQNFVSQYENKVIYDEIRKVVYDLPDRDREIILLYFGFIDNVSYTQEQIAAKLNVSQTLVCRLIKKNVKEIAIKLKKIGIIETTDIFKEKGEEKTMKGRKLRTIYEFFKEYTREEVNLMLTKLTNDERALVTLRYGEDLYNPVTSLNFGKKEYNKFYANLVPKMKKILTNIYSNTEYSSVKNNNSNNELLEESNKNERICVETTSEFIEKSEEKIQTIYEYFKEYPKVEVDLMLAKLTKNERKLVTLRYGEDLDNPVTSPSWGKEENNKFYGNLVPKMERILANTHYNIEHYLVRNKNKKSNIELLEKSKETKKIDELIEREIESNKELKNISKQASNEIEKEDYKKILELIRTQNFVDMLKTLTPKEAVIICLKLGYIDGKCFTTESISEFLGIEKEEIIEITKKVLLVYKENINQFIDKTIEITTESSLNIKKNRK